MTDSAMQFSDLDVDIMYEIFKWLSFQDHYNLLLIRGTKEAFDLHAPFTFVAKYKANSVEQLLKWKPNDKSFALRVFRVLSTKMLSHIINKFAYLCEWSTVEFMLDHGVDHSLLAYSICRVKAHESMDDIKAVRRIFDDRNFDFQRFEPVKLETVKNTMMVNRMWFPRSLEISDLDKLLFDSLNWSVPETIMLFLSAGADFQKTPSFRMSIHHSITLAQLLLDHGAVRDLNTALVEAAACSNLEIVKMLIEYGADIHASDEAALRLAIRQRNEIAEFLIAEGANVGHNDNYLLRLAVKEGDLYAVEFLLKHGADVHASNEKAMELAVRHLRVEIVETLLNYGADVHANNGAAFRLSATGGIRSRLDASLFDTSLVHASLVDVYAYKIVLLFLEHGADIHAENDDALMGAVRNDFYPCVETLLKKGANCNAQNGQALRIAASNNLTAIARMLLEHGANINASDPHSAIYEAAINGHLEMVKFLLENGANVHANNDETLIGAASLGHKHIVHYLLTNGADVHADEDQAIRWAAKRGEFDLFLLLMEHGADCRAKDDEALIEAVSGQAIGWNRSDIVEYLVAHGANVHAQNGEPLRRAIKGPHRHIVEILLKHGAKMPA